MSKDLDLELEGLKENNYKAIDDWIERKVNSRKGFRSDDLTSPINNHKIELQKNSDGEITGLKVDNHGHNVSNDITSFAELGGRDDINIHLTHRGRESSTIIEISDKAMQSDDFLETIQSLEKNQLRPFSTNENKINPDVISETIDRFNSSIVRDGNGNISHKNEVEKFVDEVESSVSDWAENIRNEISSQKDAGETPKTSGLGNISENAKLQQIDPKIMM